MKFNELECVRVINAVCGQDMCKDGMSSVAAGEVGTIMMVFEEHHAYFVEFLHPLPDGGLDNILLAIPEDNLEPYSE